MSILRTSKHLTNFVVISSISYLCEDIVLFLGFFVKHRIKQTIKKLNHKKGRATVCYNKILFSMCRNYSNKRKRKTIFLLLFRVHSQSFFVSSTCVIGWSDEVSFLFILLNQVKIFTNSYLKP